MEFNSGFKELTKLSLPLTYVKIGTSYLKTFVRLEICNPYICRK